MFSISWRWFPTILIILFNFIFCQNVIYFLKSHFFNIEYLLTRKLCRLGYYKTFFRDINQGITLWNLSHIFRNIMTYFYILLIDRSNSRIKIFSPRPQSNVTVTIPIKLFNADNARLNLTREKERSRAKRQIVMVESTVDAGARREWHVALIGVYKTCNIPRNYSSLKPTSAINQHDVIACKGKMFRCIAIVLAVWKLFYDDTWISDSKFLIFSHL